MQHIILTDMQHAQQIVNMSLKFTAIIIIIIIIIIIYFMTTKIEILIDVTTWQVC